MKILLTFLLAILPETNIWSQAIPSETGAIRVEVSFFSFKRSKDNELTRKTVKTGLSKYYYDAKGNLIEEVQYGKQHNNNVKLLDRVKQYYYSLNGTLTHSKQWDTDYDKNIHQTYYTNYTYDNENRLASEVTYTAKDSILTQIIFEYADNKSIMRLGKTQTVIKEYDSDNRPISKKQLWDRDTKMNWLIRYSYKENCIIEDFESYYDDTVLDYSKKKTECYENGRLIEIIERYVGNNGLNEKTNLIYAQNGILQKVETRHYSDTDNKYVLVGFIEISARSKNLLDVDTAEKLNSQLIDLVVR